MSDILQVRCLVCGECLSYRRDSTSPLIEHLRSDHPYIHIARLPAYPPCSRDTTNLNTRTDILSGTTKPSDNICKKSRKSPLGNEDKRNKHKCAAETRKSGSSKIHCSRCRTDVFPLIKQQSNRINSKAFGTLCMFGCWPLCFLPILMSESKVINLHCPNCKTLLVCFDERTGEMTRIAPSEPFVTSGGSIGREILERNNVSLMQGKFHNTQV